MARAEKDVLHYAHFALCPRRWLFIVLAEFRKVVFFFFVLYNQRYFVQNSKHPRVVCDMHVTRLNRTPYNK